MPRLPRPHMPLSVKLAACLDALGFKPGEEIEWDHAPALCLRARTPEGGYDPPANDPRYIRPRRKADHKIKTIGNGATTAGSDVGNARHFRDLTESQAEFQRRLFAKTCGSKRQKSGKIRGRGFEKNRAWKRDVERRT